MRAVHRAEGVVDVGVGELGERARERDVVGLLPWIEAQVLEQHDVGVGQRVRRHFVEGGDRRTEPLCEDATDRGKTQLVDDGSLGPAEMGCDNEPRAALE